MSCAVKVDEMPYDVYRNSDMGGNICVGADYTSQHDFAVK